MEVTGILKAKFDTQKVSDKFSKREFVLTTEASTPYPQHVSFQLTQDKCMLIDSVNTGEEIKVLFNLRGREWSGPQGIKYFNTLEAWKIEKADGTSTGPASTKTNVKAPKESEVDSSTFSGNHAEDDMPF